VGDQVVDVTRDAPALVGQGLAVEVGAGCVELPHQRLLRAQRPAGEERQAEPAREEQGGRLPVLRSCGRGYRAVSRGSSARGLNPGQSTV
jgi:hypothetical protein